MRIIISALAAACIMIAGVNAAEKPASANSSNDLIGKKLRVVKPGDIIDQMMDPNRVTITLDAKGLVSKVEIGR